MLPDADGLTGRAKASDGRVPSGAIFGSGPWREAWVALFWQFVADHRLGLESNPRSGFAVRTYDRMDDARKRELAATAAAWLGR